MRCAFVLPAALVLSATLAACGNSQNPTASDATAPSTWATAATAQGQALKNEMVAVVASLPEEERTHVRLYDPETNLAYDNLQGEVTPVLGRYNPSTGMVQFPNGVSFLGSLAAEEHKNLSALATTCEPYVQLRSFAQFSGISAKTNLTGNLKGINDPSDAAYNYVGLYTNTTNGSGGLTEAGYVTTTTKTGYTAGRWYAYFRGPKNPDGSINYQVFQTEIRNLTEGIKVNTAATVKQARESVIENGTTNYYIKSVYALPGSTSTNATFTSMYKTTSAGVNATAAARTTSYLSENRASGDGIRDTAWSETQLATSTYNSGGTTWTNAYSLFVSGNTAFYSYGDQVGDCINKGYFAKSVAVSQPNYAATESIYVP